MAILAEFTEAGTFHCPAGRSGKDGGYSCVRGERTGNISSGSQNILASLANIPLSSDHTHTGDFYESWQWRHIRGGIASIRARAISQFARTCSDELANHRLACLNNARWNSRRVQKPRGKLLL